MSIRSRGRKVITSSYRRLASEGGVTRSATVALDSGAVVAFWWRRQPNWGDALNPVLIRLFSGKEPGPLRRHPERSAPPDLSPLSEVSSAVSTPRGWSSGVPVCCTPGDRCGRHLEPFWRCAAPRLARRCSGWGSRVRPCSVIPPWSIHGFAGPRCVGAIGWVWSRTSTTREILW
jgi:hypothetical protein